MQHQSSDLQSFHQMWQESCGWHVRSLSKREYKLYKMLEGYHVDNVRMTAELDKVNGDFSDLLEGYNDIYEKKEQFEQRIYALNNQICEINQRAATSDVAVQVKPQCSVRGSQTGYHQTDASTQSLQPPEIKSVAAQTETKELVNIESQTEEKAGTEVGVQVSLDSDQINSNVTSPDSSSSLQTSELNANAKTYQPSNFSDQRTSHSRSRSTRGNYGFSRHRYTGRASRDYNWRKPDEGSRSQWQVPRFIPPDLLQLCCVIRQIVTCMY